MANNTNLTQHLQKGKSIKLVKTMREREKKWLSKANSGLLQDDQRKTQDSYFAFSPLGVHLEEHDEPYGKLW